VEHEVQNQQEVEEVKKEVNMINTYDDNGADDGDEEADWENALYGDEYGQEAESPSLIKKNSSNTQ